MNIFLRELKAHRTGLILWCLGMTALIGASMAKFATYEKAGQSFLQIIGTLPRSFLVVFGINGFDLATVSGFYGVMFLYIAVMGAVHAVLLGSRLISKEESDRTSEFLYAKPVSRERVLTGKLLAGLVNVVLLNLVTWLSSVLFIRYYGGTAADTAAVGLLMGALLFLQLMFFAIGAVVAGAARKPKTAPSIATAVMLMTFLVYSLVNLNERLGVLRFLSPFMYFDAAVLMEADRLDPVYTGLAVLIIAVAIFATYRLHAARDLAI